MKNLIVKKKSEKKLTLILAEAELELIPKSIQNHPVIRKNSKKRSKNPSKILLDSSSHHRAMQKLKDFKRRGRPDITHICLLLALDSQLNRNNQLQIYVHTRDDKVIWINPKAKLPKNYTRFIGLFEQLFEIGEIRRKKEVLLKIEDKTLKELLNEIDAWNVILWEKGRDVELIDFFCKNLNKKIAVVIGAFPHGDFKKALKFSDEKIKLGDESFSSLTILSKMIFSYEEAIKKFNLQKNQKNLNM